MNKQTVRQQISLARSAGQAFHIHAIRLPDGDRAEDWWIGNGHWSQTPLAGAMTLPGRYALSGMVDAHTHLSMDMGIFGLPETSEAVIEANLQDKLRQGVTAVRDADNACARLCMRKVRG